MRENNPFEDTSSAGVPDPAVANAVDALNTPKKPGFFDALKNRKKDTADTSQPADIPANSLDAPFSPLGSEAPIAAEPVDAPAPSNDSESFKKTPPVAIDGVSPDYNNLPPTTPQYEDYQPQEPVYAAPQEQPMIYQQPVQQDYSQPQDQYANPLVTNQPLPVNYGTTPNIYNPYDPYATMVDLNPGAVGAKKPDWKFVITFAIAIICFAGMIFFAIGFAGANASITSLTDENRELNAKSTEGTKASGQLEDYQNTIRDLTTKNQELKETNDTLKKNEDKIKTLETENATLKSDKESWQNKYYELLSSGSNNSGTNSNSSSTNP